MVGCCCRGCCSPKFDGKGCQKGNWRGVDGLWGVDGRWGWMGEGEVGVWVDKVGDDGVSFFTQWTLNATSSNR